VYSADEPFICWDFTLSKQVYWFGIPETDDGFDILTSKQSGGNGELNIFILL
jgi:hypothetical protein